jgi:hypothetical protein
MLPDPLFGDKPVRSSLVAVESVCVNSYPESATRPAIWDGFQEAHTRIVDVHAPGEIWVSGEFVVDTEDPTHAQVHLRVPAGAPVGVDAREVLDWLNDPENTERLSCDLSALVDVPEDDPVAYLIHEYAQAVHEAFTMHGPSGVKGFPILPLP